MRTTGWYFSAVDVKERQLNVSSRIRFMRISSELFPFASHDKYGYGLDYAAVELKVRTSWRIVAVVEG
jgi:hypothetical protein